MAIKNLLCAGLAGLGILPQTDRPAENEAQYGESSPNIIFIITDDQRWDALGYSGNEIIHTPEMDRLAEEGIYFKNAFVTTPICAASRASIMTGLYERKHEYTFTRPPLDEAMVRLSYFHHLKESGYYNGYLGKFGVNFHQNRDTALFDVYHPEIARFYWRMTDWINGKEHTHLTDLMGQRAVNFIREAPEGRPFCLTVSYNAPHAEDSSPDQYIWPPDMDSLYRDVIIPPPPLAGDRFYKEQPEYVREGINRMRWYWRFNNPEKYQHSVKGYYRMISGIDRTIGWIRDALVEKGLDGNTVIILIGDNGYFLGERQFAGKWLMYENSLRVPLIFYDPENPNPHVVEDMALNIDIAPTILDVAGLPVPVEMQGESLAPYARNESPLENRGVFLCEHLWDVTHIPSSEGIRTSQWKYFRYRVDPNHEELYNLEKDPLEQNNLAKESGYQDLLEKMRGRCDSLIRTMSN